MDKERIFEEISMTLRLTQIFVTFADLRKFLV